MGPQIIEQNGKPAFVVLTIDDYNALISDEEFMKQALDDDDGIRYPAALVDRIFDGENAVKAVREWRDMTQDILAEKSGLSTTFISMLETRRRTLTDKTASKLAKALKVGIDILQG